MNDLQQGHMPPPPSAPPEELDTSTPAFGPVTRFTQADWPRYAEWLARRVSFRWPFIPEAQVPRLLTGQMSGNETAMFKADEAVGLFRLVTRPFEPPVIETVFLFTNGKHAHPQARAITREAERWGKSIGAVILYADMDSDIPPKTMQKTIAGKEKYIVYRDLMEKTP